MVRRLAPRGGSLLRTRLCWWGFSLISGISKRCSALDLAPTVRSGCNENKCLGNFYISTRARGVSLITRYKFKARIREMTRRTRGNSLPQVIADLAPYLLGWRGYFGFCQTPRVLTNLEAWIRRRLRAYLWRQWQNGPNRFKELRQRGLPKFHAAVAAARRLVSGACPDIRPSNRLCATRISPVSVFPASTFLATLNLIEPPWYGPVCPVVWEGWRHEVSPYPDHRRNLVIPARSGEGPLTILFADLRHRGCKQ